jgi:rhamnogalacturonan endolyase
MAIGEFANKAQKTSVWMIMPGTAYETSAGGPFMRDINSQTTSGDNELYWYMNSGHVRTEPWRLGLMGPYAMAFT